MREVIPFFHDLPAIAITPAARLWDEAQSVSYNGQTAYQDFAQDLRLLHVDPPPRSIVRRWIAGVQVHLIPRPGGEQKPPYQPLEKPAGERQARRVTAQEKLAAALPEFPVTPVPSKGAKLQIAAVDAILPSSDGVTFQRPLVAAEIDPETRRINVLGIVAEPGRAGASNDFEAFAAKLFDATLAEIKRDAEAKAAKLVASRLREIADRYDASAA
ncbi:hypothetical protein [Rhizobium nepotum]|uniref:Uncharacterized protein n=1 Tax=Rhizobium nepotum 39/7 TaxID=1368418 RepID=A0ABR5CRN8_9HYPH|nr:hypothetical protein [Rhizobium nepotum]KJF67426.1 hypothetical protein RS75_13210 [Rhizobium nepotum 39/7]